MVLSRTTLLNYAIFEQSFFKKSLAMDQNCVFSHDVMVAIFVSKNNETAVMFVSQTSPVGVELFSYVNAFFCSNKFANMLAT